MDERFAAIDKRMDERFTSMEKQIGALREDMNKRFEQQMSFLWILSAVFIGIIAATIGFALWDRKTTLRPVEEKMRRIETTIQTQEIEIQKIPTFINILRELAKQDVRPELHRVA